MSVRVIDLRPASASSVRRPPAGGVVDLRPLAGMPLAPSLPAPVVIPLPTAAPAAVQHNRSLRILAVTGAAAGLLGIASATAFISQPKLQNLLGNNRTSAEIAKSAPVVTAQQRVSAAELNALLASISTDIPASSSLVVIDLKSGVSASHNGDQAMISASLYKLFVALAVYKQIDAGTLSGNKVLSGGYTVSQCLERMIVTSDNPCGVALGNLVGWSKQNSMLEQSGFTKTQLAAQSNEITSAQDVSLLLKRLYDGTLLSPRSNTEFMSLLKRQKVANRLPMGLPSGTQIAHKTGDLDGISHDAGIIYAASGPYIVSMMTTDWHNPAGAPSAFAAASKKIHTAFQTGATKLSP